MRKITISTALDSKRKEHPIYALFSDSEGGAPFLTMQTQKHLKRKSSYIANLRTEARRDRKDRLKKKETMEPTYISEYQEEVKEFKREIYMYNKKNREYEKHYSLFSI